jgi:hypothetical protein
MFPAHSSFALLPALLSVAPIVCKVQLVILTIVSIDLVGPVLTFLAIFMLLSEQPSGWRKIIVVAAGLGLIVFSILISEYAAVTAAVGCILLGAKAIRGRTERKRERQIIAGLIAGCALFSYSVLLWLTRASGRDGFRPGYILESFSLRIPFRLLSGIWRGAIGGALESLGSVTLNSKAALLSFVCGVVFSGLVVFGIHKKQAVEFTLQQDRFSVITLLAILVVALIPVVLMDRTLESKWDSRFWLPILPVISSLSVYILFSVLRTRLYLLVPVFCGFLAGYWTTSEIASSFNDREPAVAWVQEFDGQIPDWIRLAGGDRSKIGGIV